MRTIFVNLPVKDVQASRRFFGALGFTFNKQFSDNTKAAMVIEENIVAMLLEKARFQDFITTEINDAAKTKECSPASPPTAVKRRRKTYSKAIAAGGRSWLPPQDHAFMYGVSFLDPDDHVWEIVWMDPAAVKRPAELVGAEA